MANLNDLIVNGASRFIGTIYASNGITGTLTGSVSGNASTSSQVYETLTNPSSSTRYYLPFSTDASSGNKSLLNNNGIGYSTKEGTASTEGWGELILGNSTATGSSGNKRGYIMLYGSSSGYTEISPGNHTTSNITITLPSSGGTLALNTAASQSAAGLMSAADKKKLDSITLVE